MDNYNNYNFTPDPNQTPDNNNYNYQMPPSAPDAPKGKSIGSMVCGILSIVLCSCYGVVGIILGVVAIILSFSFKKDNGDRPNGMSQAGFICGIIGLVLSVIMLILMIISIAAGSAFNYNYYNNL